MNSNTRVNCQKCGKTFASRKSLCRHKQKYRQALKNKKNNEGNASAIKEMNSQISTETGT